MTMPGPLSVAGDPSMTMPGPMSVSREPSSRRSGSGIAQPAASRTRSDPQCHDQSPATVARYDLCEAIEIPDGDQAEACCSSDGVNSPSQLHCMRNNKFASAAPQAADNAKRARQKQRDRERISATHDLLPTQPQPERKKQRDRERDAHMTCCT